MSVIVGLRTQIKKLKASHALYKENADHVLQYIIDHEHEDFKENPSRNHVYFYAISAANGADDAEAQYRDAVFESVDQTCIECQGNPSYLAKYEVGLGPEACRSCGGGK